MIEDSVHVYTLFGFLPEAQRTLSRAAIWADQLAGEAIERLL